MVPTRDALLRELDSLGHGARDRRLALLGRDFAADPALRALLRELLRSDAHQARLALVGAAAARDGAVMLSGLEHPSIAVRVLAARLAGRHVEDEAALERAALAGAPLVRRELLKAAARRGRTRLCERLHAAVLAGHGPREAAPALRGCSEETIRRELPLAGNHLPSWRGIALRHPATIRALVRDELEAAPAHERAAVWARRATAISGLAEARPAETLELAIALCPAMVPWPLAGWLARWGRRFPERVFSLITAPERREWLLGESPAPLTWARRLDPGRRLELARLFADRLERLTALLAALPPRERAPVFEALSPLPARELPPGLLEVLPHAARDREAARMLELREVRESPERALEVLSFRSIEVARPALEKALRAARAEDRARAWSLLVSATGRSRRGLDETLASAPRLENEQDPVRLAALSALSAVPPSLFADRHADPLLRLATAAVEARDTSFGTRGALRRLAFRLMRQSAGDPGGQLFQASFQILRLLARQAEFVELPPLERELPRGAEERVVAALLPMMRSANRRESYALAIGVGRALGRRAFGLDMLQQLLGEAAEASAPVAAAAISLWLRPPRTRDARVRRLLDRDESAIALPEVFEHLHRRRQEWLDPFLEGRALKGRFLTGKTGYVPNASGGFHRWLPRQQRALERLLSPVVRDASRSHWERAGALRVLGRLPACDFGGLVALAGSPEVPVAEAALGALAWTDEPERALPALLNHLDSDRARVAMYAVPRCAERCRPEVFGAALEALLGRARLKVTVHKEALRLLPKLGASRSLALLEREWARPQLHRDVRIAAGHSARNLLWLEGAWRILDELARSPEAELARSLADADTSELPPRLVQRYVRELLVLARHPDVSARRSAFAALARRASECPAEVAAAASERLGCLEGTPEWTDALAALVAAARSGRAGEHLLSVARALVDPDARAEWNAGPERDLPARQRLLALCGRLLELPFPERRALQPTFAKLSEVLGRDPTLWLASAALELSAADWTSPEEAAGCFARIVGDPLATAHAHPLAARVAQLAGGGRVPWSTEALLAAGESVANRGAPGGLVALQAASLAGARSGWDGRAVALLRQLRAHPSVEVRAAARDRFRVAE